MLLDRMGHRYGCRPSSLLGLDPTSPEALSVDVICISQHDTDVARGVFVQGDVVPVVLTGGGPGGG